VLSKSVLFAALATLCLSIGVAVASAGGGNSGNAQLCQQGGWKNVYTSTGGTFNNSGDCTSYAAKGGTISTSVPPNCSGGSCTYTDPVTNTSVTAPQDALLSVTFGPPNEPYSCNSQLGPSIGAIATYVPNPAYTGPVPYDITVRYNAAEVQAYVQAHDHYPKFCLDKGTGFQQVDSCDSTDGQTPCVDSQGYEYGDIEGSPLDYAVAFSVTPSDPRVAMGN